MCVLSEAGEEGEMMTGRGKEKNAAGNKIVFFLRRRGISLRVYPETSGDAWPPEMPAHVVQAIDVSATLVLFTDI